MSIEFDEDKYGTSVRPGASNSGTGYAANTSKKESAMGAWLMKHGLAKSQNSANVILLGIVIVNFIICFLIINFIL